jgi:hypothetical protein
MEMSHVTPRTLAFIEFDRVKTTWSAAILTVFSRIPLEVAEFVVQGMFTTERLTSERLVILIECLIELINGPIQIIQAIPYDTWITGLCTALVNFNQHEHLMKIIDETTLFLTEHLFREHTCDTALEILFWFVRYDQRMKPFLIILDRLSNLIEHLRIQHNNYLHMKLVEFCQMAIAIHPEYNINNRSVLTDLFQTYPHADLNILSNHRHVHARFHCVVPSDKNMPIRTRVGIINLGNTCYVNSVVQALYQCDLFRQYVLEHCFHQQHLMRELQLIFARLNLSRRPFIDAGHLVNVLFLCAMNVFSLIENSRSNLLDQHGLQTMNSRIVLNFSVCHHTYFLRETINTSID